MQGVKKESGWIFEMADCHIVSGPTASAPSDNTTSTFSSKVEELTKKAEAGDANAEAELGYVGGPNYNADNPTRPFYLKSVEAVKWDEKAAEQGNAKAQFNLGFAYQLGLGGFQKDEAEAIKWYNKAAEAGYIDAQCSLADMLTNDIESAKWCRKAADAGSVYGQYSLGYYYKDGIGMATNHVEAARWFRKAADQGNSDAMLWLGRMYWSGDGVATNHEMALDYYRKAVQAGNKDAQAELSKIQNN